jgi:hypothetical protein
MEEKLTDTALRVMREIRDGRRWDASAQRAGGARRRLCLRLRDAGYLHADFTVTHKGLMEISGIKGQ